MFIGGIFTKLFTVVAKVATEAKLIIYLTLVNRNVLSALTPVIRCDCTYWLRATVAW